MYEERNPNKWIIDLYRWILRACVLNFNRQHLVLQTNDRSGTGKTKLCNTSSTGFTVKDIMRGIIRKQVFVFGLPLANRFVAFRVCHKSCIFHLHV